MNIQVEHIFGENAFISEDQIGELEKLIDRRLPTDYRSFIMQNNGGFPKPNIFSLNKVNDENTLDLLYGFFDSSRKNYNLLNTRPQLGIPKTYLAIGEDPGGGRICIGIGNDNYGKIFFWDHEQPEPDNIYLIGNSFMEFIDGLH